MIFILIGYFLFPVWSIPMFQQQVLNGVIQLSASPGFFPGGAIFENLADFFSSVVPGSTVALCRGDVFLADPADWNSMPSITLTSCVCDPSKATLKPVVVGAVDLDQSPTTISMNGISVWRFPLTSLPKGSISAVWVDNVRYTLARWPNGDTLWPTMDIVSSTSFKPASGMKNMGGWIGSTLHIRTANDTFSQAMVRLYNPFTGVYTIDKPILKPKKRTVTVLIASDESYRVIIGGKVTIGSGLTTTNITTTITGDMSFVAIEGINTATTSGGLWAAVYVDGVPVTSTGVSNSKFLMSGTTPSNSDWFTTSYWSPNGTWSAATTACNLNWGYTMVSPGLTTNPVWPSCGTGASAVLRVNLNFSTNPSGFYFDNVQSELDTAGEYFTDASFLYIAPLAGVTYKSPSTTDLGVWVTVDPTLNLPFTSLSLPTVAQLDVGEFQDYFNGSTIGNWNGYIQETLSQRPLYFANGGFNNQAFVRFIKSSAFFLNGGSETLNIATNGGLTMIAALKFTSFSTNDRIIDFGNELSTDNIQMLKQSSFGLNYETYSVAIGPGPSIAGLTPISTGFASSINYNWLNSFVLDSGKVDNVAARFSGFLRIDTTATYTFSTASDDGVILTVSGTSVINAWVDSAGSRSGTVALTANTYVPIQLWYYDNLGSASVSVTYNSGSGSQSLSPSALFHNMNNWPNGLVYETSSPTACTSSPSFTGATLLTTGIAPNVNYNWGSGNVLDSGRADCVLVRFYGFFKVETTATYTFSSNSDDGIILTIAGTIVINAWTTAAGARSGTIALTAGTFVPIEIKYFENTGSTASISLSYNSGSGSVIIPSTLLFYRGNDLVYSFNNGTSSDSIRAAAAISLNEWATFACRYNASTRLTEILKNGVVVASKTLSISLTDITVSNSLIGNDIATGANYFDGDMGGLRVYDRALSNDNLAAIFNSWNFTASDHELIPYHLTGSVVSFDTSTLSISGIRFDKMLQGLYLQRTFVILTDVDFTNMQQAALMVVDSIVSLDDVTVDQADTHGILIESSPAAISASTVKNVGLQPLTLSSNHFSPIIKGLYASVGIYASTLQSFTLTDSSITDMGASSLYISSPTTASIINNTFQRSNLETIGTPFIIKGNSMTISFNQFRNYFPTANNLTGNFYDPLLGLVLEGSNNTFIYNYVDPGSLNASYFSLTSPSTLFHSNLVFNSWMSVLNTSTTYGLSVYNNSFFSIPTTDGVDQFIRPDTNFASVFSLLSSNVFCNNYGTVTPVLNSDVSITGNTLKGNNKCYDFDISCSGTVIVGLTASIDCNLTMSPLLSSANMYLAVASNSSGVLLSRSFPITNVPLVTVPILSGGYGFSVNSTIGSTKYYNIFYSTETKFMAENKLYVYLQEPNVGLTTFSNPISILDPTFTMTINDNEFNPFSASSIQLSIVTGYAAAQIDLFVSNSTNATGAMIGTCFPTVGGGTVSFNLSACYSFAYGATSWEVTGNSVTRTLPTNRFWIYGRLGSLGGVASTNSIALTQPSYIITTTPLDWIASLSYNVTWSNSGVPSNTLTSVTLFLGSTICAQVNTTAAAGLATLVLPTSLATSSLYFIRISSTVATAQSAVFTITRGRITLVGTPSGWLAGGKYNVSWTNVNLLPNAGAVLTLYNGPTVVSTVSTTVGASPLEIQVPGTVSTASTYYLSLSNSELNSQSSTFIITEGTFSLVTVPVGWYVSNSYTITWTSVNITSDYPVDIHLMTGSTIVATVSTSTGSGTASLLIPGTVDTSLLYFIRVGNDIHFVNSATFSLLKGTFDLTSGGIKILTLGATTLSSPQNMIFTPEKDLIIMSINDCTMKNYSFVTDQTSNISPPGCAETATSLRYPMGICTNTGKSIYYVTEWDGGRLLQYNLNNATFSTLADINSATSNCAVSSKGDVYFPAFMQHVVYVYNATTGATRIFAGVLNTASTSIDDCGRLSNPWALTINDQDNLIVSHFGGSRICMYYPDGSYKQLAGNGNAVADGEALLVARMKAPLRMDFDRSGNLYFTDRDGHNVRMLKASNNEVITIAGTGSPGSSMTQFNTPHGGLSDGLDGYYVADSVNNRIQLLYNTCPVNTYFKGSCLACPTGSFAPSGSYDCGNTWIATQRYRYSWAVSNMNTTFPTTVSLMLGSTSLLSITTVAGAASIVFPLPSSLVTSLDYYIRLSNSIATVDTPKFSIKRGQIISTSNQLNWAAGINQKVSWKSTNLISFAPLTISLLQDSSPNLVMNGDFEHFTSIGCTAAFCIASDNSVISPWSTLNGATFEVDRFDTWSAYSGNWSMDMNPSSARAIGQNITVKPTRMYQVMYHIKSVGSGNRTGYAQITNGATVISRQDFWVDTSYHGTGWWRRTFRFTVPAGVTLIRLELWSTTAGGSGPILDDVRLQEIPTFTSTTVGTKEIDFNIPSSLSTGNLLMNGSFEKASPSLCAGASSCLLDNSNLVPWGVVGSTNFRFATGISYGLPQGDLAVDLNAAGPYSIQQTVVVVPGKVYTLTYMIHRNIAGGDKTGTVTVSISGTTIASQSINLISTDVGWIKRTLLVTMPNPINGSPFATIQFTSTTAGTAGPIVNHITFEETIVQTNIATIGGTTYNFTNYYPQKNDYTLLFESEEITATTPVFNVVKGKLSFASPPTAWYIGIMNTVTWNTNNMISSLPTRVGLYNGATELLGVDTTAGAGTASLFIPLNTPLVSTYTIIISNEVDTIVSAPFQITKGSISVSSSLTGWFIGSTVTLGWSTSNFPSGTTTTATLYRGATQISTKSAGTEVGSVNFDLSISLATASDYYVTLSNSINSFQSATFSITRGSFDVTNGGMKARTVVSSGLSNPEVVQLMSDDTLWIGNIGDCTLKKFSFLDNQLYSASPPGCGKTLTTFHQPLGMCTNSDGSKIYVTEIYGGRLVRYYPRGQVFQVLHDLGAVPIGISDCQVNSKGDVFFTSQDQHVVYVYNITTSTTRVFAGVLNTPSTAGSDCQYLKIPWGLTMDERDNLYVTSVDGYRVCMYYPDGTYKLVLGTTQGNVDGDAITTAQFKSPAGMAFDRSGNLYVADVWSHTLRLLNPTTNEIITVMGSGSAGSSISQFNRPQNIIADDTDGVYIADRNNNRIQHVFNACPANTYFKVSCLACPAGSFTPPGSYSCSNRWVATEYYRFSWEFSSMNASYPTTIRLMNGATVITSVDTIAGGSTVFIQIPSQIQTSDSYYINVNNQITNTNTSLFSIQRGKITLTSNTQGWLPAIAYNVTWSTINLNGTEPVMVGLYNNGALVTSVNSTISAGVAAIFVPEMVPTSSLYTIRVFANEISVISPTFTISRTLGSISVTTVPSGWLSGDSYPVSWTLSSMSSIVSTNISLFSGSTEWVVVNALSGAGTITWTLPPTADTSSSYFIRIRNSLGDTSSSTFTITRGTFTISTVPSGWIASQTYTLNWVATNMNQSYPTTVVLLKGGVVQTMWNTLSGTNSITITVPASLLTGNDYVMRVNNSIATTDTAAFIIYRGSITLTSNTVMWLPGGLYPVTWTTINMPEGSAAMISLYNGATFITSTTSVINATFVNLKIPETISTSSNYIVNVTSLGIVGTTPSFFIDVTLARITITTTPSGWISGSSYPITWTTVNMSSLVITNVSIFSGTTQHVFVRTLAGGGIVSLRVPPTAPTASNYFIRVSSRVGTQDSSTFTITRGTFSSTTSITNWIASCTYLFSWTFTNMELDYPTTVNIMQNGAVISSIPTTASKGSLNITVPDNTPSGSNYYVSVMNDIASFSTSNFTISRSTITVTTVPSNWLPGSNYTVQWTYLNFVSGTTATLGLFNGGLLVSSTQTTINALSANVAVPDTIPTSSSYTVQLLCNGFTGSTAPFTINTNLGSITISTNPSGWVSGSTYAVQWSVTNITPSLSATVSLKLNVLTIASVNTVVNAGSVQLRVPANAVTSSGYYLEVKTIVTQASNLFTITQGTFNLTSPTMLVASETVNFQWTALNMNQSYPSQLSLLKGSQVLDTKPVTAGQNSYSWTLHHQLVTASDYYFQVSNDIATVTSNNFTVMRGRISLANTSVEWVVGGTYSVTWSSVNIENTSTGLLELVNNLGVAVDSKSVTMGNNATTFTVSKTFAEATYSLRLTCLGVTVGNTAFQIYRGTLTPTTPSSLFAGSNYSIGWTFSRFPTGEPLTVELYSGTTLIMSTTTTVQASNIWMKMGNTLSTGSYRLYFRNDIDSEYSNLFTITRGALTMTSRSSDYIASRPLTVNWNAASMDPSTVTRVELLNSNGFAIFVSSTTAGANTSVFNLPSNLTSGNYLVRLSNDIVSVDSTQFYVARGNLSLTLSPTSCTVGNTCSVGWSSINLDGAATLTVNLYRGPLVVLSTPTTVSAATLTMTIPVSIVPDTTYRMEVTTDEFSVLTPVFNITKGTITITGTTTGWVSGSRYAITWTSSSLPASYPLTVGIYLRTTEIVSVNTTVGAGTAQLLIPPGTESATTYVLRLSNDIVTAEVTNVIINKGVFTITTVPNVWIGNQSYIFAWTYSNMNASYPTTVTLVNSRGFQLSNVTTAGGGSRLIAVPASIITGQDYKVILSNDIDTKETSLFTVNRGSITIDSGTPSGLAPGYTTNVTWTPNNLNFSAAANISLQLNSVDVLTQTTTIGALKASILVPAGAESSAGYRIRIATDEIEAFTPTFTISRGVINIITTPTEWLSGFSYPVNWTSFNITNTTLTKVNLYRSSTLIGQVNTTSNASSVLFRVPPTTESGINAYYIQIINDFASSATPFFTITRGTIQLNVNTTGWISSNRYYVGWTYSNMNASLTTSTQLLLGSNVVYSNQTTLNQNGTFITIPFNVTSSDYILRVENEVNFQQTVPFRIQQGFITMNSIAPTWTTGINQTVGWSVININPSEPMEVSIYKGTSLVQTMTTTVGQNLVSIGASLDFAAGNDYSISLYSPNAVRVSRPISIVRSSFTFDYYPTVMVASQTYTISWNMANIPPATQVAVKLTMEDASINSLVTVFETTSTDNISISDLSYNLTVPSTSITGSKYYLELNAADVWKLKTQALTVHVGALSVNSPSCDLSTCAVNWTSINLDGSLLATVSLLYGGSEITNLKTQVGTGSASIPIPSSALAGDDYQIEISTNVASSRSPRFSLTRPLPTLVITCGEMIKTTVSCTYAVTSSSDNIKVYLGSQNAVANTSKPLVIKKSPFTFDYTQVYSLEKMSGGGYNIKNKDSAPVPVTGVLYIYGSTIDGKVTNSSNAIKIPVDVIPVQTTAAARQGASVNLPSPTSSKKDADKASQGFLDTDTNKIILISSGAFIFLLGGAYFIHTKFSRSKALRVKPEKPAPAPQPEPQQELQSVGDFEIPEADAPGADADNLSILFLDG